MGIWEMLIFHSRFFHSCEYSCDCIFLMGSWFKERKCFMNAACMLEWALKDTLVFGGQYGDGVGCVKNMIVCSSGDLCTDG